MTRERASSSGQWFADVREAQLPWLSGYRALATAGPIVVAILAGMAMEIDALAAGGVIAATAAAVVSPLAGLGVLAFMMPLKPPQVIPAPGFTFILVGAILLGCLYRLPIDRPQPRANAPLLLLTAFVVYVGIQQLPELAAGYRSPDDHEVGFLFLQLLSGLGSIIAAAYVLRRRSPYPVLAMALAGAALAAIIAIGTYDNPATGPPLAGLVARPDRALRAVGPFGNPNYLGAFAAIVIASAAGLLANAPTKVVRSLILTTIVLVSSALLLSQSRSALVAVFAGLAALAFSRSRALAVPVVGLGIVVALVLYPAFVEWRLANEGVLRAAAITGSDEGRAAGALAGPQLFLSSPIFGIGFGHYTAMSVQVPGIHVPINAHNWYVTVLAEQGLVGTVLWGLLGIALIRAIRDRPAAARRVAIPVFVSLAAACLFLEAPTSFQTVALPSLVLVATLCCDWGGPGGEFPLRATSESASGRFTERTD